MANEIDPATVQRCIEVLRGKGEHEYRRVPYSRDREECWTYTTHPIDLLQALLPEPEKSEAEKLVDEWQGLRQYDWFNRDDTEEQVSLVQFVLDKVNATNPAEVLRDIATDIAKEHGHTVDHQSFDAASEYCATPDSQPKYVFGPWIEWHGGECPVPDDWEVETVYRYESLEHHKTTIVHAGWYNGSLFEKQGWEHKGAGVIGNTYDITHYRVRFEVGKWYNWAGGPYPVLPEQWVEFTQRDNWSDESPAGEMKSWWNWSCAEDDQIVKFRCIDVQE